MKTAFFGDTKGCHVPGVDDADHFSMWKMLLAPSDGGASRLGRVTFSVRLRGEDPTEFGKARY